MKQLFKCLPLHLFLFSSVCLASCSTPDKTQLSLDHTNPAAAAVEKGTPVFVRTRADSSFRYFSGIRVLFEDSKGNLWFGTEREGFCRFDGKWFTYFSAWEEWQNEPVLSIREDQQGLLWIKTKNSLYRFNGYAFTTMPLQKCAPTKEDWQIHSGDLWFRAGADGEVYRFDGQRLSHLYIPRPEADSLPGKHPYNPYWVFSILKDKNETLWLGTLSGGVVRYDGHSFTYLNEQDLGFTVNCLFEDSRGSLWFGNNGGGIYRYNEQGLTNLTARHGLSNETLLKTRKVANRAGTAARIFAIAEDASGNMWFGTIDAGLWKYDGKAFTNYTMEDGLPTDGILAICKDRNGLLWFGGRNGAVFTFDGQSFTVLAKNVDGC